MTFPNLSVSTFILEGSGIVLNKYLRKNCYPLPHSQTIYRYIKATDKYFWKHIKTQGIKTPRSPRRGQTSANQMISENSTVKRFIQPTELMSKANSEDNGPGRDCEC